MKSDASGIFIAAACIFLAQRENATLDAGKIVIIMYAFHLLFFSLTNYDEFETKKYILYFKPIQNKTNQLSENFTEY